VDAARRVSAAGFDLVQLHGDQLLGQLVSASLNGRSDAYGGELAGRLRFALELVDAVRQALPALPLDYKLPLVRDGARRSNGSTLAEAPEVAAKLREAGVDGFHVTCGASHERPTETMPAEGPEGCFVDLAVVVKAVVDAPVAAGGRVAEPLTAARLVASGRVDLVALGRALICDPTWPTKAREGRLEEIVRCAHCNVGCLGNLLEERPIECTVSGRWSCP
jgi:2,4-dienoyl-CoA reductase-like NADH-dependent reductase (Old Yellow Enzyme family)